MVITYYGLSCFKVSSGDTVFAIEPFLKESGLTPPRFEAHAVIASSPHPNYPEEKVFQITGPGEYEFKGIYVKGIKADSKNTIYIIIWEDMRLAHMGNFSQKELSSEIQEQIGTPDILFIPVGGGATIDSEEAVKIINQIEPRIVIPMNYKKVDEFLKEMGEKAVPEEKLTIKKKDLPSAEDTKVIVLKTP
ncbi:MAG: MBL fold metallo-hydrolase [Patescibacteria group bacterium]